MINIKLNIIGILSVIAIILAIIGLTNGSSSNPVKVGGTSNYDTLGLTGLTVGPGCNSSYGTCTASGLSIVGSAVTAGQITNTSVNSTSSTAGQTAGTLTQADLSASTLLVNLSSTSLALTLPATSTLTTLIPNSGNSVRIAIVNASSTGGNITLVAGTGDTLVSVATSSLISALRTGFLDLVRLPNTNVSATLTASQ